MANKERCFINPYPDFTVNNAFHSIDELLDVNFWKNWALEKAFQCIKHLKAKSGAKYCDGSVYTGNLGLIFMCYKLVKSGFYSPDQTKEFKAYMKTCLIANETYFNSVSLRDSEKAAFFLGKGGMSAMGVLVTKYLDIDNVEEHVNEYSNMASTVKPINFLSKGSDELFVR